MTELLIPVEVPENRQVTITLPAGVPTGPAQLTVRIEAGLEISPSVGHLDLACAFPQRPIHAKLAAEYDAFQRLLPSLLARHRDAFAAISNGQVVEIGSDRGAVLTRAFQKTGDPMVYVERVTDQPQVLSRSGVVREAANGNAG